MATPSFWYSPNGDAAIVKVDIGRGLTDLLVKPRRLGVAPADGVGQPHRFDFGDALDVTIEALSLTSPAIHNRLLTMETALRAGRGVTFAHDPDKLWVGAILTGSSGLTKGDTLLETTGNIFDYVAGAAGIAAGDIVCIESGNPEGLREYAQVDSISGNNITLTSALRYTRTPDLGVIVRHYRCFPALYLPDDSRDDDLIYTENAGNTFNLEATLRTNGRFIQSVAGGTITAGEYTIVAGLNL